jgi:8-oxo-dGTP pyrophosphatase MutT (NUDIX family)
MTSKSLPPTPVVTCFLESDGQILLLRRSEKVGSYQGRWAGVSGYMDNPDPDQQAMTEILEETGLSSSDVTLVKKSFPIPIEDPALHNIWIVHSFLFHVKDRTKIHINWENLEMRWIDPHKLDEFVTVPGLQIVLASVYDLGG